MSDKRQNNQLELAFKQEYRGEAPNGLREGTESLKAKRGTESPATEQLIEEVCEREKLQAGIETSQGQQRKRWRGRDGRSRTIRVS